MGLPGFTAEASIYQSTGCYLTGGAPSDSGSPFVAPAIFRLPVAIDPGCFFRCVNAGYPSFFCRDICGGDPADVAGQDF